MVNGTPGWGGYYLSAYGIAVKHGYTGTEEEWLESLNGADVEMRFQDEVMQWKTVREKEWHTMEGFQKYIETLQAVKSNAETATEAAIAASENVEEKTAGLSSAAEAALQSATGIVEAATEAVETANTAAATATAAAEGLDAKIAEHLENSNIHISEAEKSFLERSYSITTYVGSGSSSRTFRSLPGNKVPYMILGLCQEHPPCVPGANGELNVYWDFWLSAGNNINLGGGGILVDEVAKTITVKNGVKATASAWTPCTRNLNANGALYVLLLFYNLPAA